MVTTDKTAPFFGLCGASTGGARAEPGLAPGTPARPERRVVEQKPVQSSGSPRRPGAGEAALLTNFPQTSLPNSAEQRRSLQP